MAEKYINSSDSAVRVPVDPDACVSLRPGVDFRAADKRERVIHIPTIGKGGFGEITMVFAAGTPQQEVDRQIADRIKESKDEHPSE